MRMQMKTATDDNGYRTIERETKLEGEMRMQIIKSGTITQMQRGRDENANENSDR